MPELYHSLSAASKLAIDACDAAVYLYECAHTEPNRQARDAAREVLLRELRADWRRQQMEADEAAAGVRP